MNKTMHLKEYKELIKKLKEARVSVGLTQKDVSDKLKKPQSYISKVENGEQRVDIIELKTFAKLYRRDINYFCN